MLREIADGAGGEIDLHGIAKGFAEKQDSFPIVRPISALAELGEVLDVRREVIGGAFAGMRLGADRKGDDE
jgi:hypothetical protein